MAAYAEHMRTTQSRLQRPTYNVRVLWHPSLFEKKEKQQQQRELGYITSGEKETLKQQ